ncbi:DUF2059 domain-containing protein [Lysobacter sp. A6]|uniref:DUF2059 domain-containing protein n=1 Tax=Noviluteimonas lactosilytica TaxID=2888523 RepID=A0ABS8JI24_9GAMM|nr:DUF2059 domain-containing protein [Lysobacter lactosilyticus]MCC8363204.1 DUF2059 domain-containing protein [Lysobacter lactosilyticus]
MRRLYDAGLAKGNRNMRRMLLAVVLSLVAPMAFAAKPTDAQIDRLFEVMRQQQMLDSVLGEMEGIHQGMLAEMTKGKTLTADDRAKMDRLFAISNKHVRETLSWEKLAPKFRALYAESLGSEDIEAITAFYASPAGQRYLDKMPALMQKSMGLVQELTVPMLQRMQEDMIREFGAPANAEAGADVGTAE